MMHPQAIPDEQCYQLMNPLANGRAPLDASKDIPMPE
jgi:hypothetical protein